MDSLDRYWPTWKETRRIAQGMHHLSDMKPTTAQRAAFAAAVCQEHQDHYQLDLFEQGIPQ